MVTENCYTTQDCNATRLQCTYILYGSVLVFQLTGTKKEINDTYKK